MATHFLRCFYISFCIQAVQNCLKDRLSNKLLPCHSFLSSLTINHCLYICRVSSIKTSELLWYWINQNHSNSEKNDEVHSVNLSSVWWYHPDRIAVLLSCVTSVYGFSYCLPMFCFPEVSCMSVPSLLRSPMWTCLAEALLKHDPFGGDIEKMEEIWRS